MSAAQIGAAAEVPSPPPYESACALTSGTPRIAPGGTKPACHELCPKVDENPPVDASAAGPLANSTIRFQTTSAPPVGLWPLAWMTVPPTASTCGQSAGDWTGCGWPPVSPLELMQVTPSAAASWNAESMPSKKPGEE